MPEEEIERRFKNTKFEEEVKIAEVAARAQTEVNASAGDAQQLDLADAQTNKSAPVVIGDNVSNQEDPNALGV